MAVPNYKYLKLKMTGPGGVITIGTSFQRAYECEVECYDHAAVIIASTELVALRKEVTKEAPDPKRSTRSFKLVEGSKEVLIDPSSPEGKVVRICRRTDQFIRIQVQWQSASGRTVILEPI